MQDTIAGFHFSWIAVNLLISMRLNSLKFNWDGSYWVEIDWVEIHWIQSNSLGWNSIQFSFYINFIGVIFLSLQVRNSQNYIDLFKNCYKENNEFEKIKLIANDLSLGKQFESKQKKNFDGLINYIVKNIEPSNEETNLSSLIGLVSFLFWKRFRTRFRFWLRSRFRSRFRFQIRFWLGNSNETKQRPD